MAYRNPDPFFEDPAILQAIVDLASADRVVLYVGAGATIDRTGLGWADLISELLSDDALKDDHITADEARLMTRVLEPVEAGSLAAHYFKERFGGSAGTRLDQALERALYSGPPWRSGLLSTQIIRLALGLKQVGKDVHIVTTNYDTFLEAEYCEQASLVPEDVDEFADLEVYALEDRVATHSPGSSKAGSVRLTYLHGRIEEGGHRDGRVALTELDYFAVREDVLRTLRGLFTDTAVLIMGASLTDPPLLAALQETAPVNKVHRRYALTPVMSYSAFAGLTTDEIEKAKSHLAARMDDFRVHLLFPDFFSQVAQFCQEVTVALQAAPTASYDVDDTLRYGKRLRGWWHEWQDHHMSGPDVERCYQILVKMLRRVEARSDLCPIKSASSRAEQFKLEVWVRWEPSSSSRRLGLWAVSTGIRRDFKALRKPELDADSQYEAVQTFVRGAPRLKPLPPTADPELWKSCLSVPLYYRSTSGILPVGVISLLGSLDLQETRISVADVTGMRTLVVALQSYGESLLMPQLPVTDPI